MSLWFRIKEKTFRKCLRVEDLVYLCCCSLFTHSTGSNCLQPHGLQHTRLPYPSQSPGVCSNLRLLNWWCHPNTLSSVIPFSSCLQSFPASGSLPMCWLFASDGQNIGASASGSVLLTDIQGLISFRIDWFDLLAVHGTLKSLLQHYSSEVSIIWLSAFFMIQLSHPYMSTGKNKAMVNLWATYKCMVTELQLQWSWLLGVWNKIRLENLP